MLEVNGDMCSTWLRSFGADFPKNTCTRLQLVKSGTGKKTNVKPDHVVLICDETLPKAQWNLGRVITVHPDKHVIDIELSACT